MKHYLFLISAALLSLLLCQCSKENVGETAYNERIAGFTSGNIPRNSSVFLLLSQDLDAEKMNEIDLNRVMSISPVVNGTFSFADAHTIVFKPSDGMSCNMSYTITVDLKKIFNDKSNKFSFSFKTYPFQLNAALESFDVTETGIYIYDFAVRTLDEEDLELVRSVLDYGSLNSADVKWEAVNGHENRLKISFAPTKNQKLVIRTKENSDFDIEAQELITVDVPTPDELSVFDAKYVSESANFIQITFNKVLDSSQNLMGLAYIVDNEARAVEMKGNKIRLFPDNGRDGEVSVFLSQNIRSKDGVRLAKDETRSIELQTLRPAVEFVDEGNIVPISDQFVVPFRSIYMKGVKVRVFRIFQNNLAAMLQKENVDGYESLKLLGRPVAVTTFYLDETTDYAHWTTSAIDLSNLVKTEPGSIYRVELDMDHRLSAWPEAGFKLDKNEIEGEDRMTMAKLNDSFDDAGSWYYLERNIDWSEYQYNERNDPSKKSYYMDHGGTGKNVTATNIGLVAIAPSVHKLSVIANNLSDAKGMPNVAVAVYNKQMQVLGNGETNSDGRIDFEFDTNSGAPFFVIASKDGDKSGIRVVRGEELSTSTFDVSGENVQRGLKGYLYGERGIWRPGDTLFLTFMMNDREKTLLENHPVVLEISNPMGQSYAKQTKTKGVQGIYTFAVPTDVSAPTGSWLANVQVGGAVFSKRLRIESIKPNRLKIDLKLPESLTAGSQYCDLHTEWLNGAKTHNQRYEVIASFAKNATKFDNWNDYNFDDASKIFNTREENIAKGTTNQDGDGRIQIDMPKITDAPGKLRSSVTTRVYESSGEFSTDVQYVDYSPYTRYVGIKVPNGEKGFLPTGRNHEFQVVSLSQDGRVQGNVALHADVYKLEWYWWWNCDQYSLADYSSSEYRTPVKKFMLKTDANGKTSFSLNLKDAEWGTYFIRVTDDRSGHSTGVLSYFDWSSLNGPRSLDGRSTAVTLSMKTDKDEYKPNDMISVTIPSTEGSRAIVSLCNSAGILDMRFVECNSSQTTVTLKATEDMMPNAYVCATVIQPFNHTDKNDLPIRLYGVQPIRINAATSRLNPEIKATAETKPMEKYTVTVTEKDGRPMAYTLAVVDEGLLDLTRFKTPNAWNVFNAKEALGMRMWDVYNYVCGAYGGRIDQMFSVGGDDALYGGPKAIVNRFTPMVYFKGPFELKRGGKNSHSIEIPNYNGRVRVMVVAGDGEAYGAAEKSVTVKKPLMVISTMPRQIGVGDEMTVSATIFAMEKNLGDVKTTIECTGNLEVVGDKTISTRIDELGDKTVQFRVKAGQKEGKGIVTLKSSCSSDRSAYQSEIAVRSVSQRITTTNNILLKSGKNYSGKVNAPGTERQKTILEVSGIQPLNVSGRVSQLMESTHGCAEQLASAGLANIYLKKFTDLTKEQQKNADENVKNSISKLKNHQTYDGGITYWQNYSYPSPWVSAYVLLFLDKASEMGYYVDDSMMKKLKNYVETQSKNWKSVSVNSDTHVAAFSLYALAENNNADRGTMNRMKESVSNLSEDDKNLLASAYALIGQTQVAKQLYSKASDNTCTWYNSDVARLIVQTLLNDDQSIATAENVRKRLASNEWMSTSDLAMSLFVMDMYYKKNGASNELKFNIETPLTKSVSTDKLTWSYVLTNNESVTNLTVTNNGSGDIYLTTTTEGYAVQSDVKAVDNGLKIVPSYGSLWNDEISQGSTFTVSYNIVNTSGRDLENIVVTHVLPAGFEVLFANNRVNVDYQDVKDDRVVSHIAALRKNQQSTIRLTLSATYAGIYYVPSITAECQYDNKIFGCGNSSQCRVK